jgi:multifunctional beta-oxidation protein
MKSYQARFTGHVFPGETLVVESWKEGAIVIFQTKVKERGTICLKGFLEMKQSAKL